MKFNENFRKEFQNRLKESQPTFKKDCIDFINAKFETFYQCLFGSFCKENYPFKLDHKTIVREVDFLFEDPTNFDLQLRVFFTYMHPAFFNNEIKFQISKNFPANFYYTDRYWDYESKIIDFRRDCEEQFWGKVNNIEWYNAIANFPCFLDITIESTELGKYKEKGDIINVEGWLKYLKELLRLFFSDFIWSEKMSTKKMARFLKPLNDDLFFGFEYDESGLKKRYQNGDLEFPEYFNLILVNKGFKKTIKKEEYIFKNSEDILSLGILGNPLFFDGCGNLTGFVASDRVYERGNPRNTSFKYFREYVSLNNNQVQIVHTEGVGERMKRHAFFYMDTLSTSSSDYLKFLEKNILATCGNNPY